MLTIAVTGGIASGKSTVAHLFNQKYNIPIIDSDIIAKHLVDNKTEILNDIIKKFGQQVIINHKLNRRKLRELIFNSKEDKEWLEKLLHPLINQEIKRQIKQLKSSENQPYCLVLIPLITKEYLFANNYIDKVLVIDCNTDLQLTRASQRDNENISEIKKIIACQLSREKRLELGDYVVENNSDLNNLHLQIEKIHNQLVEK